jgi:hypothetical protein
MIEINLIPYNGWEHCLVMRNEHIKLVLTTDVGPRILFFGAVNDSVNMFHEYPQHQGLTGSKEWLHYGGHRLWHSPQIGERPNEPDNESVPYSIQGDTLSLFPAEEPVARVRKELRVTIIQDEPRVYVNHRIYNNNSWPIRLASWGLSIMRGGGIEILPIPREKPQDYLPNYMISYWPWTKPNDHRFALGEKYMFLRHDPNDRNWFKIGYRNTEGWGAYLYGGYLFVKRCGLIPGAEYPDFGASFETFADNDMVELETLSPLQTIDTGAYVEHTEEWRLAGGIATLQSETEIDEIILPLCE